VGQVSFSGTVRLLCEELVSSDPERNGQEGTGARDQTTVQVHQSHA